VGARHHAGHVGHEISKLQHCLEWNMLVTGTLAIAHFTAD